MTQEKVAIATIVAGKEGEELYKISRKQLEKYSQKVGADLIIIRPVFNQFQNIIFYEKMQLFKLLQAYDRVLYIDSDILIADTAPNLFAYVPENSLGVCLMHRYTDYHQYAIDEIMRLLGEIPWPRDSANQNRQYFNAGVILASRKHRYLFDPENHNLSIWAEHDSNTKYMADQTYLNYRVHEQKINQFDVGYRFNHTNALAPSFNRFSSYFLHYAGSSHRNPTSLLKLGKQRKMLIDRTIISSNLLLKIMIKFDWIRKALDLIF